MILEEIKNIESNRKELRKFALAVAAVLIGWGLYFLFKRKELNLFFFLLGFLSLIFSFLKPTILKPLHIFMRAILILVLGIITKLSLCMIFYVVLTPTGFIAKLVRKEFLNIEFKESDKSTYWEPKDSKKVDKKDYEKQF